MKEINFVACAIYDLEVFPEHTAEKEQGKDFLSPLT
jgi:hypothetical protein